MKGFKAFYIMSIVILLAQLVIPNLAGVANAVGTSTDNGKIEVKKVRHDQVTIDWEITVNQSGEENDGVQTDVELGPGLVYGTVESVPNVEMKKTETGYQMLTPAGKEKYVIYLTTTIEEPEQIDFDLQVASTYGGKEFTAADGAKVIPEINVDLQALIAWVNVPEGEKPSATTVHVVNEQTGKKVKSATLSKGETSHGFEGLSKYDGEGQINQYSVKGDAVENYETTIEKYTVTHTYIKPQAEKEPVVDEKSIEEDEGISEDVIDEIGESTEIIEDDPPLEITKEEMLEDAVEGETLPVVVEEKTQEEGMGEDYLIPFLGTSRGNALRSSVKSNLEWPNPGAIDLDKVAIPTDKYGEWEINLTVQGKNIETSSDVVLVFDKSGSMSEGGRLPKAKAAAKEFVDNLLTENSNTRIALVSFSTGHAKELDFTGVEGKQQLKNKIDGIKATGGTNIQAGLHEAQTLLNGSNAENKSIVLLSDGAPTYSFKAGNARSYTWPSNKYNFALSNFNYGSSLGNGSAYNLPTGFLGIGDHRYTVNGHRVTTNGIATISEAKMIMDAGTTIYSVGLEVGNDQDAVYVLQNSQNGGSYIGGEDDLDDAFEEIASKISYAARDAVVTDPMGDMFDLVMAGQTISPGDYTISQGSMNWNPATETFDWYVGNIVEGTPVTLTYKVKMDFDKNPQPKTNYPTNKETYIDYEDVNGEDARKNFPIPEVSIDSGSILKRGYLVNVDGQPINSNGDVVPSRQLAHQFYSEYHAENGNPALDFGETYSVNADDVPNYTLIVGDDPTLVDLQTNNPSELVWFGYVDTTKIKAGDVSATYVDEDGNEIASSEVFTGNIGAPYTTVQKDIEGYVFKEMGQASAPVSGIFKVDPQEVIYVYEKLLGSVTVIKVDAEGGAPLNGAKFELQDMNGDVVAASKATEGDGRLVFENLELGDYQLVETKAPDGYRMLAQKIKITIEKEELHIEKTIENTKHGWEIPETGGFGTLGFYGLGALLMAYTLIYFLRKRKVNN